MRESGQNKEFRWLGDRYKVGAFGLLGARLEPGRLLSADSCTGGVGLFFRVLRGGGDLFGISGSASMIPGQLLPMAECGSSRGHVRKAQSGDQVGALGAAGDIVGAKKILIGDCYLAP